MNNIYFKKNKEVIMMDKVIGEMYTADKKIERHKKICDELNMLYSKKNKDYGDSFHQTYIEERMAVARIRIGDKFRRFCNITKNVEKFEVKNESIRDTLIDLANYAIMTVMEIDIDNGTSNE